MRQPERIQTVVIGGGQAGLSVGYHLANRGLPFVILEANARIGDTWRRRWDSLRLFTPARFDGIPGLPFPAAPHAFPTKDEMADYLEGYVRRFALPVRTGVQVERLSRNGSHYLVTAGGHRYEAEHVVVAMATYQRSKVPSFARRARSRSGPAPLERVPESCSTEERAGFDCRRRKFRFGNRPRPDRAGHQVWMSGRSTGEIPFRISGFAARHFLARLVLRFIFHRVLTTDTPVGRKARPKLVSQGGPLIRVKARDLAAAGVERVPRTVGVRNGLPVLEDGRVLEAQNVVWCTGYHPGHSWIDLPVFDKDGEVVQNRGIAAGQPGLYFVGLHFLYAMSSTMIHGVGRDAEFIAETIAARVRARPALESPPALAVRAS